MEQEKFNKLKLITSLTKIGHGNLEEYLKIGLPTVQTDPYLFAHLISWNHKTSKIKDSKIAFPVIALRGDPQFAENAIACLCSLGPRELARAYNESKILTAQGNPIKGGQRKKLQWAINEYLRIRENDRNWWESCAIQNRKAIKTLYTVSHRKPSQYVQMVLFDKKYAEGTIFHTIANLKNMTPKEAAGNIINHKIPLTVAIGASSGIKNDDMILALLEGISGNELLNNTKMFEKFGVNEKPALKAAYETAIERAKKDKKVNVYKASKATEVITNEKLKKKLLSVQSEQEKKQKGIEGDCLILGDCSVSMTPTIEKTRKIAALLSSQVKGRLLLIFFNDSPKVFDVTGMNYQQIYEKTQHVIAYGNTAIGCGIDYIMQNNIQMDMIVIVSDGGDNGGGYWRQPPFDTTYQKYVNKFNYEPTVYHLWVPGDHNRLADLNYVQHIDMSENFDEYAFSNLLNIIKANKYQLLDDILNTPLLTFSQVFREKNYAN